MALLSDILRDYLVAETVNPGDARMSKPEGFDIVNLNGRLLNFRKSPEGE